MFRLRRRSVIGCTARYRILEKMQNSKEREVKNSRTVSKNVCVCVLCVLLYVSENELDLHAKPCAAAD